MPNLPTLHYRGSTGRTLHAPKRVAHSSPQLHLSEVCALPDLCDQWVAVSNASFGRGLDARMSIKLSSGAVVVDADPDLDVLCQRLTAERRTSLTIVFAGRQ